ncbi:YqaJ viral recombinase family protein [Burkholderia cepacia]|uniref:YqaJ viral recombinase family protein n=1 Tax=Burkholderia cepacia TaxID=292 RepID=UPI00298FA296|nr:YqaJ viral recombinase family protein [Burkholderia cepacia]MDW9242411.1 yqaJ-like viral recombinase domain protein [Burkholderia cepacia]
MTERITHPFVQGSQEWLSHRANYWNASDAPAMMGVSPYKTRSELLREKATGAIREVDDYTQSLFDDGHRFEALCRPLAEEIVGTELYPVSMSYGRMAASLDGITMLGNVIWEHKSLNDAIRAATCGADLPIYLRVQMEQQFEVSDAEKCLFQASRWDAEGNLLEEVHHWYESDPELRKQVTDGWLQFEADLAAYIPVDITEKPSADAIMALPTLAVQIRGEVITSNLPAFKAAAEQFIAGIKTDLETDEDFVNADAVVKFCEAKEKEIAVAMDAAIAQMSSIDELMRTGKHVSEQLRTKRLALSNQIEQRKKQIKESAVAERRQKYADHVASLNAELAVVSIVVTPPDFIGTIKGLKTIASLYDKLDTALANGKIAADAAAKDLRAKLDWYGTRATEHAFLFRDLQQLIQKPSDDFQLAVNARIDEHKRQEAEKEAKRKADEAAAQQAVPVVQTPAPIAQAPISRRAPVVHAALTSTPTLRLGQINERLAPLALTAEGLATLGFKHAATDKAAKLYHEEVFPEICAALVRHIEAVAEDLAHAA